jgi:hypothetical protein
MRWTGASERTVKNWFAGTNGPRGEHLLVLARHSDAVFDTLLELGGREAVVAASTVIGARRMLVEMRDNIDEVLSRMSEP